MSLNKMIFSYMKLDKFACIKKAEENDLLVILLH